MCDQTRGRSHHVNSVAGADQAEHVVFEGL